MYVFVMYVVGPQANQILEQINSRHAETALVRMLHAGSLDPYPGEGGAAGGSLGASSSSFLDGGGSADSIASRAAVFQTSLLPNTVSASSWPAQAQLAFEARQREGEEMRLTAEKEAQRRRQIEARMAEMRGHVDEVSAESDARVREAKHEVLAARRMAEAATHEAELKTSMAAAHVREAAMKRQTAEQALSVMQGEVSRVLVRGVVMIAWWVCVVMQHEKCHVSVTQMWRVYVCGIV